MYTLRTLGGLSLHDEQGAVSGRATQKRRLALLALLSAAPRRTLSRDKLVAYLWPDSDSEQARHLLSMAVYEIRRGLGEDTLVSRGDEVCLSGERVGSDLEEFLETLEERRFERAAELYAGPFLDGFFLSDAPEFERWASAERERIAQRFAAALESLAAERMAAGDARGAVTALRRLAVHDPYNARIAVQLMRALAAAGDRAGALQHARIHGTLLREEFGADPDPEVAALAARLLEEPAPAAPQAPAPIPEESPAAAPEAAAPVAPSAAVEPATSGRRAGPRIAERAFAPPAAVPPPPRRRGRLVRLAPVAAVLLVVSLVWAARQEPAPPASLPGGATIAVLPFADVSPARDNEYFSDGLTEEIMNALARVEGVQVAARTSAFQFKGRNPDVREVGRQLSVRSVLEGSVRKSDDRLKITVRLVDVASGYDLWSETYERRLDDVFEVQDEIARSVVGALRVRLVGGADRTLVQGSTDDAEAYNLYLRGRYHWHQRTREGFGLAISHFQQAAERDPDYALAHSGIADVYSLLASEVYGVLPPREAMPRAKAAAQRALELDPELAEAHATLANINMIYDWDWAAAEAGFRRAMALNPAYTPGRHWYSLLLVASGRPEEGLAETRRARELDPLSLVMSTGLARILYFTREHDRAIAEYRRALEMDSTFVTAHLGVGLAYLQKGEPERALAAFRTAERLTGPQPVVIALIGHAHGMAGREAEARRLLAELQARAGSGQYVPPEYLALVHVGLGERSQALDWLERAHENRSATLAYLGVEPLLDPLRGEPRFRAVLARIGLPTGPGAAPERRRAAAP
jgi:TolB-like protein/DNA-binding SARP family transcriptional activator/Tfp pilus assembly protein PilF